MGGKLKWYGHWGLLGVWVSVTSQAQQSPQTVEQHSTNGWNGDDQMKNARFDFRKHTNDLPNCQGDETAAHRLKA